MGIDPSEVHYRLVVSRSNRSNINVACVQNFDYDDYEGFVTEELFATEEEAQAMADRANDRPWKIKMLHNDQANVLEEAVAAWAEDDPNQHRGTSVAEWMMDRAQKIRWGLL
jgi:hypothetical protein